MPTTKQSLNTTHRRRLARRLADTTGVPYQQAHAQVIAAADAGLLPTPLDPTGMDVALSVLATVGAAGIVGAMTGSKGGLDPLTHRLMGGPTTTTVYQGESNRRVAPTCDVCNRRLTAGESWWMVYSPVRNWANHAGVVCERHDPAALPLHTVGDSAEESAGEGVSEDLEVAESATSNQSVTPPEPVAVRPPLVFVAHEGNPVPRCTGSSWRGAVGKRTGVYGPGGYNRCVKAAGHAPEDGGTDTMHVDEWGNVFRLQPKFRVLRHLTNAEMAEIARESGMQVASSFELEPIWHKPKNTLWMTQDKEMVKVSNVYEAEDRVTAQVVYPVQPRTTVRSYPAAEVARWSEPSPTQVRRYERAWGFDD